MKNGDDISKAVSLLKLTLPEMKKRNIPTTPENYAVWYEYVNGQNKDLNDAIDALERSSGSLASEAHRELYLRYVASAREAAVNKLSESVKEIIFEFLSKVDSEGVSLGHYAKTLSDFSDEVDNFQELSDVKNLIGQLLEETKKREEATLSMQSTMESMTAEMKTLRAEVARLNSEATTDALTKVNNRRAFDNDIESTISIARKEGKALSLLMIDIDHFKRFNDQFGHTIGDKVLRFVATMLKKNIKGSDSVARYGGEEFAIILPETDYEGAITVAENMRERLAKQTLSDSAAKMQLGTITVSIGVAFYRDGEISDDLVNRADKCLYEAKNQGRNRVIGERQINTDDSPNETVL